MEQMTRRIVLAAILGIMLGVAVGYTPQPERSSAPTAMMYMQQSGQPSVAPTSTSTSPPAEPLLMALAVALALAVIVFLVAKRKSE